MVKQPSAAQLEARQKFAEASRKRAAERKAVKVNLDETPDQPAPGPDLAPGQEAPTTISQVEYLNLLQQIAELKAGQFGQAGTIGLKGGSVIGSLEKFPLGPKNYPDPRLRLADEKRLARFAFDLNYELFWDVSVSSYENIEGVRVKEPKFTLALGRKMIDEETGERMLDKEGKPRGYIVCRLILHEDPDAALAIAQEQGLDVDETNEVVFLNEMRYIRMKDWLIECFYPAPRQQKGEFKELSVGGRIVESYSITSETSEKIPFDRLKDSKL